jgi:hypothetical protein
MLTRLIDSFRLPSPPTLTGSPTKDVELLAKNLSDSNNAIAQFLRSLNQPGVLSINEAAISGAITGSTIDSSPIGGTTPAAGAFTTLSASGLISANGGQIKFPASQAASADANTIDDYEEGTWTPNLVFGTPGDLVTAFITRAGFYTKIGQRVFADFAMITSTFTHSTAAGDLRIADLPFTSLNTASRFSFGPIEFQGITAAGYTNLVTRVDPNRTYATVNMSGSGVATADVQVTDMPTGGTVVLAGTICYSAA